MIDFDFGVQLGPISNVPSVFMINWRNDKDIYRWCRQYEPLDSWTHEAWLKSLATRSDVKMYGIWTPGLGMPIGVCGFTGLDLVNRRAEFSLYIGRNHWGSQYGKKGLQTLCAHGFLALGLHHIFGETFDGNPAAKTFKEVGFKLEGTRRQFYFRNGKFIDAHLYSVLAEEFLSKYSLLP